MTEAEQRELQQIRAEQRFLTARLAGLEQRLSRFESSEKEAASPTADRMAAPPPPVLPPAPLAASALSPVEPPPLPVPPSLPLAIPMAAKSVPETGETVSPPPVPSAAHPAPTGKVESLEMRIGGTWFVRIGIVLALTTLAFLGSYLYQHIVPRLGPASKVGLLYLAAGAVAGLGAWLERSRQARDSGRLRQYARIVLAGGLSAVYYVTYAAHYYDRLRVIESPLLAGGLLLGWAAFMVWLADRRGSETLATVAILLGYYTSAINGGVAGFTLGSNLVLTGGAVFLLRRHLWRVFPFASLLATFGSYAFWNYFHAYLGWRGLDAPPVHGGRFWIESVFLGVYWVLFTWAAFTARDGSLPSARRAGFVSLNNGAFFLLVTWLVLGENPHDFWRWSLGFGVVLLALAEAARRVPRPLDGHTQGAYLLQGVLLVTLGFVTYFSGWRLSLVLAAESVALLAGAGRRRNRLLLASAYAVGLLSCWLQAFYWSGVPVAAGGALASWWLGLSEGGFLVLAAWGAERLGERLDREQAQEGGRSFRELLRPGPAYFSLLGLGTWLWLLERNVASEAWSAPVLALAAVGLTAGGYGLRVRAVPVYAQGFLLAAYARWVVHYGWRTGLAAPPWWNPLLLLAATLALGHWWQRRRKEQTATPWESAFGTASALGCVLLLYAWLQPLARGPELWIGETAVLALALLAYGLATGYRTLAAAGQWFLLVGAGSFLWQWHPHDAGYDPDLWLVLGPWAGLWLTTIAAGRFLSPEERGRLGADGTPGAVYELAAMALFLAWAGEYFPRQVLFSLFCLVGGGVFALGAWKQERRWQRLSIVPTAVGLAVFWLEYGPADQRNLWQIVGVVTLAAQQWWGRQRLRPDNASDFPPLAQKLLITAATLCAWALVTAWMEPWRGSAFGLAAAWSIFAAAVFALGLGVRERPYRWLGLVVLASTLLRVLCVDIWRLDTLERTISGFCLSATFLGLGYLYNRYHDQWKDLL